MMSKSAHLSYGQKKQLLKLFQTLEKDSAIDFMYCSKLSISLTSL